MAKALSYRDAVHLLGGEDDGLVKALDRVTSGLMLGAAVTVPGVLAWFDHRAEFAQRSRQLVAAWRQRRTGGHRIGRTRQLAAAHTVLVIAAYFEVLGEAALPIPFKDLELDRAEQFAIAAAGPADDAATLASAALAAAVGLPEPHGSHDAYLDDLTGYYSLLASSAARFLGGLEVVARLTPHRRDQLMSALNGSIEAARERYVDLLFDLVRDFPELAYWANLREHRGTRAAVGELRLSLSEFEARLAAIGSKVAPTGVRATLKRAYDAALTRPIADSDRVPDDLTVPSLAAGYVPPLFRVIEAPSSGLASEEALWTGTGEATGPTGAELRDDLDEYLAGYLTSPGATRAPMLVLGQPGAGKSVLTKMLAARLPAADFLPIRVILRDVEAAHDLQRQIEAALRATTGEELRWRDVAEAADGALPVVFLDGFDELLQATGVNHSNYLEKVAEFQRREEEQGRAVAFVVTTRTSVADRARTPRGTLLLRLEPFDPARTRRWLEVWNAGNDAHFGASGLRPLAANAVLAYPDLAGQPLLLLLLALYDADDNALQRREASDALGLGELYERLLRSFAQREVVRLAGHLSAEGVDAAIDRELRYLSIVAFAMFNRSSQWVTQADLERDLAALMGPTGRGGHESFDGALQTSELLLGRFFFIHRAQAVRRDRVLQTYEFLHATFGEYLVARLTWEVLREAGARNTLSRLSFDAGELYTFLSFVALVVRTPIVTFLAGMAAGLTDPERQQLLAMLARVYTAAPYDWRPDPAGGYQPVRLPGAARLAAYTANLVLLAVVVSGGLPYSDLYTPREREAAGAWRAQALLWQSQLSGEERESLVEALAIERTWTADGERDVRLTLETDGTLPPRDPHWTFNRPLAERGDYAYTHGPVGTSIARRTNFQCGQAGDLALHSLAPLLSSTLEVTARTFVSWLPSYPSAAEALLTVMLLPTLDYTDEQRRDAYRACTLIATKEFPTWSDEVRHDYVERLLAALATDPDVPLDLAAEVLNRLAAEAPWAHVFDRLRSCASAIVQRSRPSDAGYDELVEIASSLP